ncbi:MAG: class I SAM-dependent methyltransferase [Planctomycetota bacterium]
MPTYEPFDWYETPVYYDIIYDVDTKKDATFLEQCYAKHASDVVEGKPLTILEPACGSGRIMAELASRGHRVAGVDLSQGMLDFARKRFKNRGVRGKIVQAPMQAFDLHRFATKAAPSPNPSLKGGGFDLAHILVSSFKYLQTEQSAADCLSCIADHLRVGGVLLLGIHLTDPDDNNRYLERWRAQRDKLDVICTVRTNPPNHKTRTEDLRSRLVVRDVKKPDAEPKRYESNWTFRTYSPAQLRSLLRKEPRLKHVSTYDFHHDINIRSKLNGDDLGVVLVMHKVI